MATRNAYYLIVFILSTIFTISTKVEAIGVCYGTIGDNLPPPADVVALFKSNQISSMRIYNPNPDILVALAGSNITLTVGTLNQDVQALGTYATAAQSWVAANILPHVDSVNFSYINVGNEIIPGESAQFILPAMINILNALVASNVNNIKVTTSIASTVLATSFPPSAGQFSVDAQPILGPILEFLGAHGAPLLVNIYPYFAYKDNSKDIGLDYALFNATGVVVQDGQFGYQNLFDAMVDSIVAAMEKVGGGSVRLVISESGWPSGGDFGANADSACVYNQNLIDHVTKGTPRRPGIPLETYVFAMFNENQKGPAELEKFFGLFFPEKTPVYPISFV